MTGERGQMTAMMTKSGFVINLDKKRKPGISAGLSRQS